MIAETKQTGTEQTRPLPPVLRLFWVASALSLLAMLAVGYVEFRMGFPRPHYNPLAEDTLGDLLEYVPTFRLLHTAAFWGNPHTSPVAYPPFGAVLFRMLYAGGRPVFVYFSIAAVWICAGLWGMRASLRRSGIAGWQATLFPLTVLLVSFPIAGLLQRGNVELLLWIFAASGTWAYLYNRSNMAAVLWGLAAAVKLYPVIFLVLLLPRRRFGAFSLGSATFVLSTLLSMIYLGPSLSMAWHGSLHNVFGYQGVRVGQWTLHELAANHSMFNFAKLGAEVAGLPLSKLTLPYYAVGAVVFAAVFFGRVAKLPEANQVLCVTAFMVMLPPVSYFYTLVHLYAPWMVLVFVALRAHAAAVRIEGMRRTMLLLAAAFAPFMLFTFPKVILFGGMVQGLCLAALFCCAAIFPFEPMWNRELRSRA